MPQILKMFSQLLEAKRAMLTADDLFALADDERQLFLDEKLLVPARTATHVTCDACHEDHVEEVVRIKDGKGVVSFRSPCPDAGWVKVSGDRLRQWKLDVRRLVAMLAAAVAAESPPDELVQGIAWLFGTVEIAGATYDLVFVRTSGAASESLFAELGRSTLLARTIVVGIDGVPDRVSGFAACLSLESAFVLTDGGIEFQPDRVRSAVSAQSIVAGNVFQLCSGIFHLSFNETSRQLRSTLGLRYIACLIRDRPHIVPVPVLHEMITGVPAGLLKSNSEPYSTTETFKNYGDRLEELRIERQKAENDNDSSWITRIDKEVEQIELELGYNSAFGNKIKERSDYIRVRRKIAENIRRGKTVVSKHFPALGLHLHNSIKTRGGFRYEPEQDLDWIV